MGLYLRKSVSVGPFRFNLSGSGVGVSVGVRGLRVGSGPRGNYVRVGGHGVYYQQTISHPRVAPPQQSLPMPAPDGTHAELVAIESSVATEIVDSSSEALVEEIRAKRRKLSLTPLAIVAAIVLMFISFAFDSAIVQWLAIEIGIAFVVWTRNRDRLAKTVVILYDFDARADEAYGRFLEWAQAIAASRKAWHVAAEGRVYDRKYHAGASSLVQRRVTTLQMAEPPMVKTNVPVLSVGVGRQTLYFLPDKLLVYDATGVGAVSYRALDLSIVKQRFIESDGVPSDATVVDHTWRYVNKSGGPDRRFNNNPQLPICLYDELHLQTSSGLNEVVQLSRSGIGEGFAAAVRHLAASVAA
jgi:hypothetical protein